MPSSGTPELRSTWTKFVKSEVESRMANGLIVNSRYSAERVASMITLVGCGAVLAAVSNSHVPSCADANETPITPTNVPGDAMPLQQSADHVPTTADPEVFSAPQNSLPSRDEIAGVRAAVNAVLDEDESVAVVIIGMAWSAAGTYDTATRVGGSDDAETIACVLQGSASGDDSSDPLSRARSALYKISHLFPVMTSADLLTLAAAVAVEHVGGPPIAWRPGRLTRTPEREKSTGASENLKPDNSADDIARKVHVDFPKSGGLVPLPATEMFDSGVGDSVRVVQSIFRRQGFSDKETVALMGGYAVCRNYPDRTDTIKTCDGTLAWTRAAATFSNEYYRDLLSHTWTVRQGTSGDQFEDSSGSLVMLPSDMVLLWDKQYRKHVEEFAADEDAFFFEFGAAFQKLQENGVKAFAETQTNKPWYQFW